MQHQPAPPSELIVRDTSSADGGGPVAPQAVREPAARVARPRLRRQVRWLTAAVVLLSATAAWLLSSTGPLQSLELKTYDLRFVLNGEQTPPPGILLLLIDDDTEAYIPEPRIFWHPRYAVLLRAAAQGGAKAVGLDVAFAIPVEQWAPDLDRQLAASFAEVSATTPVVLAFDSLSPPAQNLPLYLFGKMQGAMGFTNLTLDPDGFVRRQELTTQNKQDNKQEEVRAAEDESYESFAARLAAVSLNAEWRRPDALPTTPQRGDAPPQHRQLGDRTVPLDSSGAMRIRFWGPDGTFPSVSMAEVLRAAESNDAAALEQWFQGKIVLIGTADPSDRQSTPFALARGEQGLTPGVEIQASALATLLEERFLEELPQLWNLALVLTAAVLAALCIAGMRFPLGPLVLLAAVGAYIAVSVAALGSGVVLPVTPPLLAVLLSGLATYGVQAATEGRQKRLLQEVFGRYVSAEVASELLEFGEVPLGGTRQLVTIMFSDLRNFTSHCQGRDPHQVVADLNEYFSEMSAEIKAHGGMINKFIGDGIMALFGAPVPHPDDARRAVACGLKMIERNQEFNRRRAASGQAPLVIGIGIHTGEAVVGNIGAPEKMEYTAIGDAVNIAARIESENKTFDTHMLVSEATRRLVDGYLVSEPVGSAQMKGIDEPMMLYRVIGVE